MLDMGFTLYTVPVPYVVTTSGRVSPSLLSPLPPSTSTFAVTLVFAFPPAHATETPERVSVVVDFTVQVAPSPAPLASIPEAFS
jgi:hypothetical protein